MMILPMDRSATNRFLWHSAKLVTYSMVSNRCPQNNLDFTIVPLKRSRSTEKKQRERFLF